MSNIKPDDFNPKVVGIINDCSDSNTIGRQTLRVTTLLNLPVSYVGVPDYDSLALAGNAVDMLDAIGDQSAILLMNVAPRFGEAHSFFNGTPFGFGWYKKTLIISTVSGYALSLLKKFNLLEHFYLVEIKDSVPVFVKSGLISEAYAKDLVKTQFRSFNFSPLLASFLTKYSALDLSTQVLSMDSVPEAGAKVWWVDNFGNIKTTLTSKDVDFTVGSEIRLAGRKFTMFDRLKDVPDDQAGCIVGSSGIGDNRFLELVIQGKRASDILGLSFGEDLLN